MVFENFHPEYFQGKTSDIHESFIDSYSNNQTSTLITYKIKFTLLTILHESTECMKPH